MQTDWRDLIKPKTVEFDEKEVTPSYGRFFAEPLERGYGITIGNTLRRILLASLPGFAISAVRIKGVLHEFSTLPGVKEDITDIVLNLKEVRLQLHEGDELTAALQAKGEAVVTARDISGGPNLEVLTPDQHIATLDKGADLDMELVIRRGRGYVPAERGAEEEPIGTIRLDAIFSPIRKVNFTVTNARVGQRTDYDRLVLEVWTDGSISPRDALTYAARVARDQMSIFAGMEEGAEVPAATNGAEAGPALNEALLKPVAELPVSVRAFNGLQNADIKFVGELVQRSEQDMLKIKNFGRKSLNEIKEVLTDMGLSLGMRLDGLPSRSELDRMWEEQEQRESP
ncbi:MAG TPA: DNA-directed RNA polymerase subunit alpha [Candidatus Binataceae bacterium]|nr:DNA-directed RNA polymerase subunit alpha [Candidatus Binataceae bacterium]HVB80058.1 DNA-directed RNA polymerase subunit alpha [Candidatus Binataceae bacterium]